MTEFIQKTALGDVIEINKKRLTAVIVTHASSALLRRMNIDDIIQELYIAVFNRLDSINGNSEIPIFVKLRSVLIQIIIDLERHNTAQKRNQYLEVHDDDFANSESQVGLLNQLADSITSPSNKVMRKERATLLRQILDEMPEADREILLLRHFEQLSNKECASILGISPKILTMRYIRALQRLKQRLESLTEFQP